MVFTSFRKRILLWLIIIVGCCRLAAQQADSITFTNPFNSVIQSDTSANIAAPEDSTLLKYNWLPVKKKSIKRHSPQKAAWLSFALPGLGQAYNKRWWKIPIVYAGLAGMGYGLFFFGSNYSGFRRAYRIQVDKDSTTIASYKGISNPDELRELRDYHKRNLEVMAILTAVWYALNVVDAAVDAHLFHWNIDDNLSLLIDPLLPGLAYPPSTAGISLQFTLRTSTPKQPIKF
jgi:TM2 domain-containing membrane protein YozV